MTQTRDKVKKIPYSVLLAEYERRKRLLDKLDIDHDEYGRRARSIAQELGI